MIVTFCGHREVADYDLVCRWLTETLRDSITAGAKRFLLGGYGEFDRLTASVLRELKQAYPLIELILVLPYLDQN